MLNASIYSDVALIRCSSYPLPYAGSVETGHTLLGICYFEIYPC